jgi:hypothetical protein
MISIAGDWNGSGCYGSHVSGTAQDLVMNAVHKSCGVMVPEFVPEFARPATADKGVFE